MNTIKTVIIPAAGYGTRMLPTTKTCAKEMLPILNKPAIQLAVEECLCAGVENIIIITSDGKTNMKDYFKKNDFLETFLQEKGRNDLLEMLESTNLEKNIRFVEQTEMKGLGHAIAQAQKYVQEDFFAVLLPDDLIFAQTPCLEQMTLQWEKVHANYIAIMPVEKKDVSRYGIIKPGEKTNQSSLVEDIVEKPSLEEAPSQDAVIGRYIVSAQIFEILQQTKEGHGGEIQFTDALRELLKTEDMYGYYFEGKRFDTGNPLGFLQANIYAGMQDKNLKSDIKNFIQDIL